VTSILHPDGQLEAFEYAKEGTLLKKTASNGTAVHYTIDCFGRILEEKCISKNGELLYQTSNTYSGFHKTSSTDAAGLTTFFEYDQAGRLIKTICLDKIEILEYDSLGRNSKKREPFQTNREKVSCYEYDFLNRVIEERVEDEQGLVLNKVTYKYDLLGNRAEVREETEAGQSCHITHYNIDKKPLKTIDPEGKETTFSYKYDAINAQGQFVLQTTTTDPLGRQLVITHDALERPVNIKRKDLFNLLLASQDIVYDCKGNVIRLVDHVIVDGEVVREIKTSFAYQEMGKVTRMTLAEGLPEQQITRTKYNRHGEKKSTQKGDGTLLNYSYDALGRLENYAAGCDPAQRFSYHYIYNRRNQPLKVEDQLNGIASEFDYDPRGRLLTETLTTGIAISYEYDLLDRVSAIILPDLSRIEYDYDAANLKQVGRYLGQNLLYAHRYESHDLAGLNVKSLSIDGQTTSRSYDLLKRPLGSENPAFKQLNALYDKGGRLLQYDLQDRAGSIQTIFGYDSSDHLILEESHCRDVYVCDSLHNRLSKNQSACQSNALHQLISNGEYTFSYDLAGNLSTKEKEGEVISYLYDAADRLISIKGSKETHYQYDSFNRRVAKIEGGKTIRYLYAGQDEIGTIDETGEIQELRVLGKGHGAEIGASVAIELQGEIYAPMHDFRGNIVCLTDLDGTPVETYRYSAFGEPSIYNGAGEKIGSSLIGNPWQYSSKRFDPESGFYNFGRRYYDPENGRWITADPAGLGDGPNLYAYLHHHPTYAVDLYGLEEEPYYPLADVDYHDHANNQAVKESDHSEAPIGLLEKLREKKDRMFFCGFSQIAELGIGFVNGIMNSLSEAYTSAKALSEMGSDHFVNFVHNKSTGFVGSDIVRCFFELYFYMKTEAVQNQIDRFRSYFATAGPDAYYYHECHSEGAIVTRNALMRLPEEIRKRIIVLAIAPGAYIDEKYCYRVRHVVSTRDIVPLLDVVGALCNQNTTVRVKPHADAPLFDHPLSSPTYVRFRREGLSNYMEMYGGR
jgi:RHS repeat-associated protein